ncbi:hypothetical protein G3I68_39410, partial [Streptomyces sp. SID13588]|nr:hypothetical protein [Streptomyces sp. SID13588]
MRARGGGTGTGADPGRADGGGDIGDLTCHRTPHEPGALCRRCPRGPRAGGDRAVQRVVRRGQRRQVRRAALQMAGGDR